MSYATSIAAAYPTAAPIAGRIESVALRLGMHPFDLANVIHHESRFRSDARNPGSDASGLIQFIPSTAAKLGTTTSAIRAMSASRQMDYVERYFRMVGGPFNTPQAAMMAVFYPAYRNVAPSTAFPANVQRANPGIRTPADYMRLASRYAKLPWSTESVVATITSPSRAPAWAWAVAAGVVVVAGLVLFVPGRRKEATP